MSLYNGLFETSKAIKAGFGDLKAKSGVLRQMAISAKESETVQSAGPALGKMAKYAAYPVGVGAGVGVGVAAAGVGTASAIENTGAALKKGWTPADAKSAATSLFGVLLFVVFAGLAVYLYRVVKG